MSLEDLRYSLREPNVQFGIYIAALVLWIGFVIIAGHHSCHCPKT